MRCLAPRFFREIFAGKGTNFPCFFPWTHSVESSLAGEEKICFNAGSHKDVVYIAMEDYKRLVKPMIVHFSRLSTA